MVELLFSGTNGPWTIRYLVRSFPGMKSTNKPWTFPSVDHRSLEHLFIIINPSCETTVVFVILVMQITKRLRGQCRQEVSIRSEAVSDSTSKPVTLS